MPDVVGALRDRLLLEENVWPVVPVTTITRSGSLATVVTAIAHGFLTTDYVTIADALPAGYNGTVKITVVDGVTFTYVVDPGLSSPATQAITATYATDRQGGGRPHWTPVATIFAELIPLSAAERVAVGTVAAIAAYQFRVRVRPDLSPQQRARWTPRWPVGAREHLLEINGVLPWVDPAAAGSQFLLLSCAEVQP